MGRGGRERQVSMIVAHSDFNKFPAKIVYFNDKLISYIGEYKISRHTLKVVTKGFFKRIIELNRIIKENKPVIVFTWGTIESLLILILKPLHKFAFINGSVRHGIRSPRISQFFRMLLLHLSEYRLANSCAGLKANNLKRGFVLYNGVNEILPGTSDAKSKYRKKLLNISSDVIVMISVANFNPYKDYYTVLEALRILKLENYKFCYIILGDGPLRKDIEFRINGNELRDNVKIIGHVQNVSDYLMISDIFIHSSKGEGCSNAILEAMASGLPVIASDTGGTNEIVTGSFGRLFKYQDQENLVTVIKELLTDIDKLPLLGENARNIVSEKYTIRKMIENYEKIIQQVIEKRD